MAETVQHVIHLIDKLGGSRLAAVRVLAEELARVHVRQTLVYSRGPASPREISGHFPDAVTMIEVRPAAGAHIDFAWDLTQVLADVCAVDAPDVVHLHGPTAGVAGRLIVRALDARARTRTRLLYSPHGLAFEDPGRPVAGLLHRFAEMLVSPIDCQPVGGSVAEAAALARVMRRPASVLPLPVDPALFTLERNEAPESPLVVGLGPTCDAHAAEVFAELSVRLRVDRDDTRFVWIGPCSAVQERMLRAVGIDVAPALAADAVRATLAGATACVDSSSWEGAGAGVPSAMAAGLPCVVLDTRGARTLVEHDVTGLVGRDKDELEMYLSILLASASLRVRLGRNARARAQEQFSVARWRTALLDLYGVASARPQPVSPAAAPATLV